MPTPPVQRRNPSVSVRRVQSERIYLSPWGSVATRPIWKPQFEHARKTAIIPPLGTSFIGTAVGTHPYMLGTSQGVLGCHVLRDAPTRHPHSSAHPLILVAPPLFLGGYYQNRVNSKAKEGELLAQERIATFLTEETPPHKPRSLLSYPDSHLYESLISQLSDLNAEDISLEYSETNSDYLHFDSSPNCTIERSIKQPVESLSSNSSKASIKEPDCKKVPHFSGKVDEKNVKKNQNLDCNVPVRLQKISFSAIQEEILEKNSQKQVTRIPKLKNPPEMFQNDKDFYNQNRKMVSNKDKNGNFINAILKPVIKLNEKTGKENGKKWLQPTHTVVSVVHVNKENGIDEASFRESTCFKCGGNSQRSQSSSSDVTELYEGSRLSSPRTQKTPTIQDNKDYKDGIWKNTIDVPRTIELLESKPSSRQSSSLSLAKDISNKTTSPTPLSYLEYCSYGSQSSKDSTLDPLKPVPQLTKRMEPLEPKIITKNFKNFLNDREKDNKDCDYIPPLTINFDSEDSSGEEDGSHNLFSSFDEHESDSESMCSSILEFYSIATTRPDSFVYVYKSPSKSNRSNSTSRTSTMSLRFNVNLRKGAMEKRANESSGLGSSGSDDSFEDVSIQFPSSSNGSSSNRTNLDISLDSSSKSSVTFLEPSFRPSKYTPSPPSRCSRLSFDYSYSWTDLHNLVKKSSSCVPIKRDCNDSLSGKFLGQKGNDKFSSATYTKKPICS